MNNSQKYIDKVMYEEVSKTTDKVTGEIIEKKSNKVIKKSETHDFIKLFIKTAPTLIKANLTTGQTTLLFCLLTGNYITRENYLDVGSATRDEISYDSNLSRNSINTLFSQLIKKEIILKKKVGERSFRYVLNPFTFGRGSWMNIEKLRYEVKLEYNFHQNQLTESNSTATLMNESKEMINIPHHVVEASHSVDETNKTIQNVIEIAESDKNNPELDVLKEENKKIELEKQLIQEEYKLLEMKIKAKEMGL